MVHESICIPAACLSLRGCGDVRTSQKCSWPKISLETVAMQQHNTALIQASNFTVRAGLLFFLSSLAAAALRYVWIWIWILTKRKMGPRSIWVVSLFGGTFASVSRSTPTFSSFSEAGASSAFSLGRLPRRWPSSLTFYSLNHATYRPLQLAGGLARRQAAPLSPSSPSQLTRCQLGCSSPRGLRHENGRRRSTLPACLPLSGNPPGAHIHNESPAQTVRQRG